MSLTTKTIRAHVCSAANPTAFPRKLKMVPTTLSTMAGNASTAFPRSLLSASASLFNLFFKVPLSFDGGPPAPQLPPPKTPVMARIILEMVIERTDSIENMFIPCSRNKVQILSAKDVSLSKTFSRVSLILATCVWRSFRFCDSIYNLAFFSVFKSSNLSLYNCLCPSE